jgi:flagellar biosynthesis protein FliQ
MPHEGLFALARHALIVAVRISLPVIAVSALVALLASFVQNVFHASDAVVTHTPRWLVVMVALLVLGPWMATEVQAFAEHSFAVIQPAQLPLRSAP